MVTFSSAIANQYLVIPMAAIIVLETGVIKYIYMLMTSIYLALDINGLALAYRFINQVMPQPIIFACAKYIQYAFNLLTWILFASLLYYLFKKEQIHTKFAKKLPKNYSKGV